MSVILVLGAFFFALVFSVVFGKCFVPWLVKSGFVKPLKKEVMTKVYSGKTDEAAE